ncbi:MAG: hypothetical protein MR015_01430 [Clostridiales bacterium]|nr:hypothetical protein [Clostridiales bacterium]
MRMLESVKTAMNLLPGSFVNQNNELILIPRFNVYMGLDYVDTDEDFKVRLCECFSRDCSYALRYKRAKNQREYYQKNTDVFNKICKTNFSIADMEIIYTKLGNGINHELAKRFVKNGFDLSVLKGGAE